MLNAFALHRFNKTSFQIFRSSFTNLAASKTHLHAKNRITAVVLYNDNTTELDFNSHNQFVNSIQAEENGTNPCALGKAHLVHMIRVPRWSLSCKRIKI